MILVVKSNDVQRANLCYIIRNHPKKISIENPKVAIIQFQLLEGQSTLLSSFGYP